jgi:DNA-binding NarL/FixJ family response regulator
MDEGHRITVLIADDHTMVRQGLRALIESQPDMQVIAEAANGSEAIQQFLTHRPNVSVIDLNMPVTDGVEAVGSILAQDPHADIICITSLYGDNYVYRSLRAGAKGYLLKDAPREDLFACIRAVSKGEAWMSSNVASKLAAVVKEPELSFREMQVLRLLASAKSNKEIAVSLGISEGTAKSHVNNILRKLSVSSRMEAVNKAAKRGLIPAG